MIDSHLIDHFVPFLPLEKQHVELCVTAEFLKLGGDKYVTASHIKYVSLLLKYFNILVQ